jgi:hypothetical protein
MTEAEWLACAEPRKMLNYLDGRKVSKRKLRLTGCAFWQKVVTSVGPLTAEESSAVESMEGWIDGKVQKANVIHHGGSLSRVMTSKGIHSANLGFKIPRQDGHLACIVREIFGPLPFRPVCFSPSRRTSIVLSLAQTIYDEKQFDRMPILGDAIEDAGCTSQEILNHCRQPGAHVKGCWVIDLILEKK